VSCGFSATASGFLHVVRCSPAVPQDAEFLTVAEHFPFAAVRVWNELSCHAASLLSAVRVIFGSLKTHLLSRLPAMLPK